MKKMLAIASMMVTSMAFATTPVVTPTTSVPASAAKTAVVTPTVTPASTVQTPAKPKVLTAQQQKMVDCNKQATGKKGDERKAFMSACLKKVPSSASTAAGAPVAVQPQPTSTPVAVPVKK